MQLQALLERSQGFTVGMLYGRVWEGASPLPPQYGDLGPFYEKIFEI